MPVPASRDQHHLLIVVVLLIVVLMAILPLVGRGAAAEAACGFATWREEDAAAEAACGSSAPPHAAAEEDAPAEAEATTCFATGIFFATRDHLGSGRDRRRDREALCQD